MSEAIGLSEPFLSRARKQAVQYANLCNLVLVRIVDGKREPAAISYKSRIRPNTNKELNGDAGERSSSCEPQIAGRGVFSEHVSGAQVAS
jgi:hypothetical protein